MAVRQALRPKGERNGNYKHGFYTHEAIAERRALRQLLQGSKDLLAEL